MARLELGFNAKSSPQLEGIKQLCAADGCCGVEEKLPSSFGEVVFSGDVLVLIS